MKKNPIYLDYAATTPVDARVADAMTRCLTMDGNFGNPASRSHVYGWRAEEAVEEARGSLSSLIHADPREIVWTSGATESNNLALKGAASARKEKGKHIITSVTEHKAILDVVAYLETNGFDITRITPPTNGVITRDIVEKELREDTIIVSLMHVNNEIGVIHEIAEIGDLCQSKGILFHVDAAQSIGKIPVDVDVLHIDLMSMSAHKFYGPKGAGALYVRRRSDINVQAQIHGGGHERGMRSGTLATHQIVGMGKAAAVAKEELPLESKRIQTLRERLEKKLLTVPFVYLNGDKEKRAPGIANISVAYVEGETLLMSLRTLALSTGSACTSVSVEPSYVLTALGVDRELAHSSLRISVGRFTTEEEIDEAADTIAATIEKLREVSPAWRAAQTANEN